MSRALIIDHNNFFLRYYIVNPSTSNNGNQIGGISGSLMGLQKTIKEIKPDRIIVCFDGAGGSRRRRSVNKEYKEGRTPPKLNWANPLLSEQDKEQNKAWQMLRLIEYYQYMPLYLLNFDDVEADDVIASVCQSEALKGWQKVVMSSDKDFIQLLNNETILYRPVQKEILNKKTATEKYGIHPNNFSLARSMVGDESDNIKGIKGAGLPTVAKRFSFLSEEKEYLIEDVLAYCNKMITEEKSKIKLYQEILNNVVRIKENYKLSQLSSPNISFQVKEKIKFILENNGLIWNKTKFCSMMIQDGFGSNDWSVLTQCFNRFIRDNK